MSGRRGGTNTALAMTFCGMMAALGVVLMLIGGVLAVLTYAAPLMASACLLPVLIEFGRGRAWLCYLASAVLCVLLCPDKELAFFYVFIGFYPILRPLFSKVSARLPRLALKLLFFAAMTGLLYAFLYYLLRLDAVMKDLNEAGALMNVLFFAVMLACLLIYDAALGAAQSIYVRRIRPKLRFLDR